MFTIFLFLALCISIDIEAKNKTTEPNIGTTELDRITAEAVNATCMAQIKNCTNNVDRILRSNLTTISSGNQMKCS